MAKDRPSANEVSPLTAHLGYWMRYVSNHVSHAFGVAVEQRGVTVAEWVVLRDLYEHEAAAPNHLAHRLGLTRGAISKLIDRLVGKKLVTRSTQQEDRRYQELALTRTGRTLVPQLAEIADRNDALFFSHLTTAERATMERILRDIVERSGLHSIPTE